MFQNERAPEIAAQMRDMLPLPLLTLLETISREARERGISLYVVGGFVRDLLLGIGQPNAARSIDLDLSVEGDAIYFAEALQSKYGGAITPFEPFRTATWNFTPPSLPSPVEIDFATARRESYPEPGSLPVVEPATIQEDLYRRDFTINALAIRLSPEPFGALLDTLNGEQDLRARLIRALHDKSFIDDGTRMFRAARFEQRFKFHIAPETRALIPAALPYLSQISGERLRHEIDLIVEEAAPEKILRRLKDLGILQSLDPVLEFDEWAEKAFVEARTGLTDWPTEAVNLPLIYWIILTCRLANPEQTILTLQTPPEVTAAIRHGKQLYEVLPALDKPLRPSAVRVLLTDLSTVALAAGWVIAPTDLARENIARFALKGRFVRRTITGDDLLAMGLQPGPRIGKLLKELQRAWDDGAVATPEQERAYLEQLLAGGYGL